MFTMLKGIKDKLKIAGGKQQLFLKKNSADVEIECSQEMK